MVSEKDQPRRIVVGVDGSPASKDALRWAIGQARAVGAGLEAVSAWEYPQTYGWSIPVRDEDLGAWAAKALADTVAEVLAGVEPPVEIRRSVVQNNAAQALLDAARGADLLVVGSRGHGGFTGTLLGSVSQQCVHHAPCPVVVIRDRQH